MIAFENVTKTYGDKRVLDDLTIDFPDAGFIAIAGESGIGKTTVLNLVMGLETPDSGVVEAEGRISAVFQEDRLLERFSALENVVVACDGDIEKAKILLAELGLGGDLETKASELSGGMKRRTAIARCLAREADIYIMDEPIKGLDKENRQQTLAVIHKYTDEAGKLLIMVSHDDEDCYSADKIIVLG